MKGLLKSSGWLWVVVWLAGCATTLPRHELPPSYALKADEDGYLSRYVKSRQPAGQQLSGFTLLHNGQDALAARLHLIDTAQSSLDLQYYIYSADITGGLIAERLIAAAERGVRVRLLLDDIGSSLQDFDIASLDLHPNIMVRLFNPLSLRQRWLRYLSKVGEFGRINFRMHNKLMVADGQVLITGGRNIADEYFSLSEMDFQDIDIVGIGPISTEASSSFDTYWNADSSVPIRRLIRRPGKKSFQRLRRQLKEQKALAENQAYLAAIAQSAYLKALHDDQLLWRWGAAEWISDPPSKAEPDSEANQVPVVGRNLARHALLSKNELLLMSAYFVPGLEGQAFLLDLVRHDVAVKVLTNSLATTDILVVHGGYSNYRKPLLEGGVQLWELRPIAAQRERANALVSHSLASLHAKTFVFDRHKVFVGSSNLDPRSIRLNTEAGVLVEQPELAAELVALFERWTSDDFAFHVQLAPGGRLLWSAEGQTWSSEPQASRWRRSATWLLNWLPIEGQL